MAVNAHALERPIYVCFTDRLKWTHTQNCPSIESHLRALVTKETGKGV